MGFKLKSTTTTGSTSPNNNNNNNNNTSGENWGMGFLLVLFPEDSNATNAIVDKTNKLFSPTTSSSSCSTPSPSSSFKRSNSNNVLLSKAQSTISICALLVFITLLLFTLSTFEPNSKTHPISTASRRFLSQNSAADANRSLLLSSSPSWFGKMWKQKKKQRTPNPYALQRMGILYRRGTRAMPDLVVGHIDNDVTDSELRLFLRLLHRSGLTSRADIVFIFASSSASSKSASVIRQENDSFLKLLHHYRQSNRTTATRPGFDVTQFVKSGKKKAAEDPLWGKKKSSSSSNSSSESEEEAESTQQLSYGSVVGFEVGELDPENSLAGFVVDHHVAMSLRRWACYPMLLGRVRRHFKHVMLVDVKNSLVVGDPLNRARHKSAESVVLLSAKHCINGKKGSVDPTQCPVNTAVISGGARGVRRLSSTVLTEIVRAAVSQQPKKRKNSAVTEAAILSGMVGNVFVSKNINLVTSTETVPDASSIITAAAAAGSVLSHAVIQRGNSYNHHELYSIIMKQICSSEIECTSVYSDC